MKRIFTCLLTAVMLLALTAPAFADILWEPSDNEFYLRHRDECSPVVRGFYANGPEGFVTLWDAPGGSAVRGQYENGAVLWVHWQYEDWGLVNVWEEGRDTGGWVPMDHLEMVYDYQCFAEEYADSITDYNGEFADYSGDAEVVNFYEYPGAPEIKQSMEMDMMDVRGNLTGKNGNYVPRIFVDGEGRTWGFVSYMYGRINGWFCLDEPDGTDFPVREVPEPYLTPARTPVFPARGFIPYLLVGAVVIVTAGVLAVLVKKRKKQ